MKQGGQQPGDLEVFKGIGPVKTASFQDGWQDKGHAVSGG